MTWAEFVDHVESQIRVQGLDRAVQIGLIDWGVKPGQRATVGNVFVGEMEGGDEPLMWITVMRND